MAGVARATLGSQNGLSLRPTEAQFLAKQLLRRLPHPAHAPVALMQALKAGKGLSAAQRHFRRCRGVQQGGIQQGNIRMFRLHQQADLCTAEHNPLCAPGLEALDNR